uniref:Uncharacterized protein n=1 Tax=Pavo cristatus TaxID=9049 RepID=A0A8C9FLG1_PAVCR
KTMFLWKYVSIFLLTEDLRYELLLSLPVCFFSGSIELPSNNILFRIPSLSILCRILCWAKLYLQ